MKVFIWNRIETASGNWHSEGGVVVFAETEERARELANAQSGCAISSSETPDDVRETIGEGGERVFIMPDSGCC